MISELFEAAADAADPADPADPDKIPPANSSPPRPDANAHPATASRQQDHDDGWRCIEKCGGGRYFGNLNRSRIAEGEKEQTEKTVANEQRNVRPAHPESTVVGCADEKTDGK